MAEPDDATEAWDDFGQKVDLTARLREILLNYPEGTSILKELVQNADDAGATVVKVCLDERSHGTETLAYERLAQFQGPSLLVYNDSTFRESDFTSISSIGDSVKREQIGKTGRFGVGFNSVYHLTDVPSFVSGRHVVFFDPHATFLPNVSSSNPGKRVDFVKNDVLAKNFDQFAPFLAFGCDARAEFRGTTFRFPLRTKAQASSSKLSKASYAKDDVRKLLNDFKTEATLDMLFLKNVAAIEISEWRVGDDAPTTLSVSKIQSPSAVLVSARGAFARASAAHAEKGALARIEPETASRFDVTFESSEGDAKGTENAVKRRAFVVAQALGSRALHALVTTGREKFGMRLVPWAAVAAELDAANGADSESSCLAEASREPSGRAFCFLPLPVRTGLPVHVNAFFELSSNRRDVWHGGDMSGGGAARSEWNQALLEKVVSPSYVALLLAIKAKVDSGETPLQTYYALFPSGDHAVTKPWDCVVRETCISLSHEAVLHTNAGGGGWIAPRDATFPDHEVERDETLRDALIEEGVPIPDAPTGVLSRLEEHVETPLRASPNGARRTLKLAFLTAKHTNGSSLTRPRSRVLTLLRYCLSDIADDDAASASALADVPLVPLMDGTCGAFELAKENEPEKGKKHARVYYVPTAEEASFLFRGARDVCVDAFVADPLDPFASRSSRLDPELTRRFEALAEARFLNLRRVDDAATLASLMPRVLPAIWKCSDADLRAGVVAVAPPVPWRPRGPDPEPDDGAASGGSHDEGHPSVETLAFLWRKLRETCADAADLDAFRGWPLIPVVDATADEGKKTGAGTRRLAPLGAAVVAAAEGAASLSRRTVAALEEAGVRAMLPSGFDATVSRADEADEEDGETSEPVASVAACAATLAAAAFFRDHSLVHAASGAGVADALAAAFAARTVSNGDQYVAFEFSERAAKALRAYLLQRRWFGARARLGPDGDAGAPKRLAVIKGLRVYEAYPEPSFPKRDDESDTTGAATLPGSSVGERLTSFVLTSLDGDVPPCLPPLGSLDPDPALLGPGFLRVADPEEAHVLETCLGVRRVSPASFLETRVLARLDALPPRALDDAMLEALRTLGSLTHHDGEIRARIANAPFVATASGRRAPPNALYDPRVPELAALLKASADESFPAPPFDDPNVLETLSSLGMRKSVTRAAVLDAAVNAERLLATDASAAKRQGLAVLRYLETPEGAKLLSPDSSAKSKSLFGSLFSSSSSSGPKKKPSTLSDGAGSDPETRDVHEPTKLDHQTFVEKLRRVIWAPVSSPEIDGDEAKSDASPPRFKRFDSSVDGGGVDVDVSEPLPPIAAPASCRPPSDAWLCSASMRSLLEEPRSAAVADAFLWRTPLTATTLAKQLNAFGEAHATIAGEATGRALAAAVPRVYASLTSMLGTPAFEEALRAILTTDQDEPRALEEEEKETGASDETKEDVSSEDVVLPKRSVAVGKKVVWVGVGFAEARAVAFDGALHLAPYLHVLPADLLSFKPLLAKLGVRERFEADDYVTLLFRLKADAGTETPLTERRLDVALWVLGALADFKTADGEKRNENQKRRVSETRQRDVLLSDLPVPDERGVLANASFLRFNDAPWMRPPAGTRLCHPKLPSSTAQAAGVASLRLALLHEASEDIGLSLHGSSGDAEAEAFGQSEALTTRLRHILDAYADGPGVISELVQNADDAGATEVRLCLDTRGDDELGARSLLSPKMKHWQGPALLAWNDATFSPSDFKNIAKIGQDSKVSKPSTAGRFGLGFNAVYHFTDLPSFVSGEHLVLFDPHFAFLPGASAAKPGLKIKFHDAAKGGASGLLSQFPDQFAGYAGIFGCDFSSGPYDGTLFRFPLRSEEVARRSEIKAEAYTEATVRELFAAFKKRAAHALLFLKNVTKIGVYEMRESSYDSLPNETRRGDVGVASHHHSPHLLYEVRVPSFERGTDPRRAVSEWVASGGGTRQTFAERLRAAADDSLPSSTGWMDLDIQDGSVVETQRWLLSCALAGGAAKEMAISETGAARGLVPWVGAAARVPRMGSDDVSTEDGASEEKRTEKNKNLAVDGRAFCFLPLPVRTGLPVHVHAPFELSSNRRDVWHGEDASGGGRERGAWNATVLKHAVAPAYVALLRAAKVSSLGPSRLDSYYALFPGVEETQLVPEPWSVILPPLYASLAVEPCVEATDPAVSGSDGSCDTRKWIAPNAGVFPDVSTEALRLSFAPGGDLARAFAARGEWVIHSVPSGVAQAFLTHAPGSVRVATPRLAREAARSAPRKTKISDVRLALATLAYCLSDVDFDSGDAGSAASELRDAPLLPLADGTLGSFRFGDLLREKDILFVPSDEAEARLLTGTGLGGNVRGGKNAKRKALARLVDRSAFAANDALPLYDRVLAFARGAAGLNSNVRPVDAEGLACLLPDLLPDAWGVAVADANGGSRVVGCGVDVNWFPLITDEKRKTEAAVHNGEEAIDLRNRDSDGTNERDDHPTHDALAELWRLFVTLSPSTLAPFEGWPLLPVDGGARLAPLTPHGALVRGEGFSEHASAAVAALGVAKLHECAAVSVAATHLNIGLYARPASAAGVLDSAVARAAATPEAARAAEAFQTETAPAESVPELRWRAAASVVPGAFERRLASLSENVDGVSARRALRAFLLQTRWFAPDAPGGAVEGARLDLFRALPVFETADGGAGGLENAAGSSAGPPGSLGSAGGPAFRALAGGSPFRLLSRGFLSPDVSEEEQTRSSGESVTAYPDASLLLPPASHALDPDLLPRGAFLKLDADGDGALLESRRLANRVTVTDALVEHVLPGLENGLVSKRLASRVLDACVTHVRDSRASWTGAGDAERTRDAVRRSRCVPTRRAALSSLESLSEDESLIELKRTGDLFDPRVSVIAAVFGADGARNDDDANRFFPRAPFDEGRRADALVNEFGMKKKLGAEGILLAARAVDAAARDDVDGGSAASADPVRVAAAVRRGAALLAYLDALARGAIADETLPEEDARAREEEEGDFESTESTIPFWRALASVAFVPALRAAPEAGMPWPSGPRGKPLHALAPPSATRPPRDAWISSSCLRVLDVDAVAAAAGGESLAEGDVIREEAGDEELLPREKDSSAEESTKEKEKETRLLSSFVLHETLATRLGWDAVAPAAVAAQLLELGGRFPAAGVASFAAALEKDDANNTKRIAECLNASLPNAYAVLQNASRDEMDAAATILQNAPWVWTGAGFAASADVAAFASASVSFEPYLFLVPKELSDENARPLLEAFGVRDRFRAVDFARAASRLAADAAGEPIGERRVALAAALADAAADALAEYENFPFENSAERSSERSGETSTSTSRRDFETGSKEKEKENAFIASGSFMLPDASGVMAPARELTRNDAEWLLGERKGDEDEDGAGDGAAVAKESALRFAHERVSASSAAALGARSLRELYAVDQASTDRLPCPSASVVRAFLEASAHDVPDGDSKARVSVETRDEDAQRMTHFAIAAAATDILGIAEAAGAAVATVTLDVRSYATRSLLQPQLAGFQGPAIVFTLRSAVKTSSFKTRDEAKGPVPFAALDPNELAALFASAPPTKLRRGFLRAGEGLASCARLGDVVLALGGGRLCVFDPANVALSGDDPNAVSNEATIRETTNASDGDTNRLTSGSAKSFVTKDGALARRFADQFAPFVAAGWSPDGAADDDATYVRVPLRTATQASRRTALAPFGVHLAAARDALAAFAARAHAVLLFSSSVDTIVVGVASEARTETETETETKTEEKQTNGSVDVLVDARVTRCADARVSSDAKPVPARVTPRTVEEDAEWRRSSLSVFFGGGANATRCSHVVTIEETSSRVSRESVFSEKASATNVDEWIVGAAIGVGKARELALDRTKSKFLHGGTLLPVARVASHVRRDGNAVDPARAPPAPAAASLAAVAARAVADGRVAIPFLSAPRPGSGLFALGAPVPPKPDALGVDAGDPVASALRRAPGVIDAHFATKRGASSARFVEFVDPSVFLSSETDDSTERSEADVVRREWNRALCACVVAANVEVAAHARRISVPEPLPAATFYGLWPRSASLGVPPPPALDADGKRLRVVEKASSATIASADSRFAGGHPASTLYVRPLYKALAEHVPGLFRSLGTGAPTKPADGYFLPAGFAEGTGFNATTEPSSAGARSAARPLAARFIAKHFPVIDAPAEIRPELAGAGAGGAAKELTAAALRSLLRAKPPAPSEPTRVHVELLECATSDVIVAEDAAARSAERARDSRGAPPAVTPPTDSLSGIVDAMAAAGVPVNEWLGAAGLGSATVRGVDANTGHVRDSSNGDVNAETRLPLNLAAARDLLGVPAPTASGDAFPFGNGVLFVGTETMVSLVPRLRSRFLNPSLLEDSSTLAPLLNDPRFNAATKTKPFLSEELLKELPSTLPARLAPAKITGAPFVRRREDESGRPVSLDTAETEDVTPYTPSNEWLRAFWDVLATRETPPGETFAENPFGEWPLVSCESSMLVRVKHVGAVFAPPVSFESNETDEVQSSEIANARFADGSDRLKSDWHWLAPALRAARFPVLDRSAGAACAAAARSAAPPADASFAIRTPADAFVWKLASASACFAPFAAPEESRGAFPFDFGNASSEFKKTMFETLVSQFAASGFSKSRAALEAVKTRLPIFATARGDGVEFILLNEEQSGEYCTCPPDVPFAEASYRSKKTLAYDAAALPLFRALGVLVLDDASLLALHVVPELGRLPIQGRAAALAYVLKHWHRLKDSETLVEALSNARFVDVDDANGGGETTNDASEETPPTSKEKTSLLKSPSDLYDPEVELFALTFKDKPNYFPSRAFQSREWLAVLRACGLRSAVDAKLFTECATRVAARAAKIGAAFPLGSHSTTPRALSIPQRADSRPSRARGSGSFGVAALLTDEGEDANEDATRVETHGKLAGDEDELRAEVLSAGFALASHLAAHASSLYSVAFCETLAGVPFVPAAFGVPGGRAETMRCNVLCAFSQGSLPTHWPVAFMARPTMHPSCVPPAFARSALRVKSGVSAEITLAHLLALGGVQSALRKWPHDCELDPVAAVRASLKAVAAAVADGDFSSAEIETLKRTAFVPVADGSGAFAEAPARLFARAPASLAPLRHEIPPGLAECLPTLRLLGARETFGPRDAAEMLRVAAADAGGRALAPDEVKAAVVALAVAAEGVSVGGKTSGVSRASAGGLDAKRLDVPFAPDRRGVLTPPSALFHAFGAPAWLVSRARASSRGRQEKKLDTEGKGYAEISLRLAHPSVPEETCRLAGIAALADAAKERRVVFENAEKCVSEPRSEPTDEPTDTPTDELGPATRSESTATKDPKDLRCAATESLLATLATRAFAEALRRATARENGARKLVRHGAFASAETLASRLAHISARVRVIADLHTRLVVTRRDGNESFAGAPTRRASFYCPDEDVVFVKKIVLPTSGGLRAGSGGVSGTVPKSVLAHVLAPALADALCVGASGTDGGAVAAAAAALLSAEGTTSLLDVAETVAPATDPTFVSPFLRDSGKSDDDAKRGDLAGDSDDSGDSGDSDSDSDSDDAARYAPGTRVSRRDAAKLRLRPMRPLAEGETVALAVGGEASRRRFASPAAAAASAAAARADGVAQTTASTRERRFAYARVVSATRPAGGARALASATLETTPGVRETRLASEVFTFALASELAAERGIHSTQTERREKRNVSRANANGHDNRDASLEDGRVFDDESARRKSADCEENGVDGRKPGASSAGGARSSELAEDGPSPAAFAKAVRELLAAAETPMPSDAESMLASNQALRADLAAAVAARAASMRSEKETLEKARDAANNFLCPITQTAMGDPVLAMDGHTYERNAIERWFANGRATSPVTNARLLSLTLVPNHALKSARAAFEDVAGTRATSSKSASEDEDEER